MYQCTMFYFTFLFDHRNIFWILFISLIIILGAIVSKAKYTMLDNTRHLKKVVLPSRGKCLLRHNLMILKICIFFHAKVCPVCHLCIFQRTNTSYFIFTEGRKWSQYHIKLIQHFKNIFTESKSFNKKFVSSA